ncbi:hypothetical protein B0A50_04284 [Salinomyces thailandicus]|uniref:F-box domain-containing protein n=1 Tax=Salinomyces thailandicus TaxID=706561 RepID=A0A4U0TWT4_9PEZI|nr:hypothetical protein B0A50_04284 [Salinomyces thailandica]
MAERTQFAAPRSNKVMCCEKAAEVATSLAVNAYTLVKAAIKHLLHGKDRKSSPATFGKLFDLPPELRDSIYEHYFSGDIGLSCRGQPRSPHAAAILLANKQLYEEAKPVMLKVATFSINLDAKHSKHPEREMTYYFDHPLQTGEHFIGDTTVFKKFRNFHLYLDTPPLSLKNSQNTHWQRAYGNIVTTVIAIERRCRSHLRILINLGNLAPDNKETIDFTTILLVLPRCPNLSFRRVATKEDKPQHRTETQLSMDAGGQAWVARTSEDAWARFARFVAIHFLGQTARSQGFQLNLENHDRTAKRAVQGETVLDLVKEAAGLDDKEGGLVGAGAMIARRDGPKKLSCTRASLLQGRWCIVRQ